MKFGFALLAGAVCQVLAADAPKAMSMEKTKALLCSKIGKIVLPEQKLEKRIVTLRAMAYRLGLELTVTDGVEAVAKNWTYPAVTIQDGSLDLALKYTADVTKLFYHVENGRVHLLLESELKHESSPPKKGQQASPFDGDKPSN